MKSNYKIHISRAPTNDLTIRNKKIKKLKAVEIFSEKNAEMSHGNVSSTHVGKRGCIVTTAGNVGASSAPAVTLSHDGSVQSTNHCVELPIQLMNQQT